MVAPRYAIDGSIDARIFIVVCRMIGSSVRSLYEKGKGFPCFVSVEQDGTGKALESALALSRAIGATKAGAIASSAREETAMDLFAEQALWPNIIMLFRSVIICPKLLDTEAHCVITGRRSVCLRRPGARMRLCATRCASVQLPLSAQG